ncbi:glycosyltransferase family 4 protein [Bradyrhizobium sp. AUGA SZCCT0240]|uniref:glycosyltransferase family 4 protein n=1 Tax=unclassified Bradyrhizobium TaxID=2631580 RepID=UPI001BA993B0|nr:MULTISPECIES: glycosyltransferase family 4 protein [unclassified Bradyrhizobium]MBR1195451.1 glycosyltransferase family 4 protein [Bradyrhizobium sp. AUGA SZCCT0158]MBR1244707.1 glycosyltransferase family 4 protein [Bradyrhizobium sp. AUGA SZCCT0274]MBR1257022.1 glycosyltransferase family 4 protein [Bradyrhizobium sp. AUGA SZCCT0240]
MRILIVNTLYPPEIIGGAEVSVSLLAQALSRNHHQVSVVSLHDAQNTAVSDMKGVRVYRLQIDNDYWPFGQDRKPSRLQRLKWHLRDTWNRKAAKRFAEILDIEKPDVVHTNNLTGFSVALWSEARRRNIRIVHTLRDYSLLCKRSTLFKNGATCERRCTSCAAMTASSRLASRLVDAVASNSQYVLDRHQRLGYFSGIPERVIFNIADTSALAPAAAPSDEDDLTFGFIGRIEAEKGIDVVLKATELLPDTGWQLKIAGSGLESDVREFKARHPSDRVKWLGFAKSQDFYAGIDVCLISSVWPEPLPRTLIEGISAGRATICSTAGGIPEISGFSNLIGMYQPSDHRELAGLMLKGIDEAARWKKSLPPRPDFAEKFTPETITREYLEMYSADS